MSTQTEGAQRQHKFSDVRHKLPWFYTLVYRDLRLEKVVQKTMSNFLIIFRLLCLLSPENFGIMSVSLQALIISIKCAVHYGLNE